MIVSGPDGALWFTGADYVGRVDTSGDFTMYTLPASYSRPVGLTVGADRAFWFTWPNGSAIGKMTMSGNSGPHHVRASVEHEPLRHRHRPRWEHVVRRQGELLHRADSPRRQDQTISPSTASGNSAADGRPRRRNVVDVLRRRLEQCCRPHRRAFTDAKEPRGSRYEALFYTSRGRRDSNPQPTSS